MFSFRTARTVGSLVFSLVISGLLQAATITTSQGTVSVTNTVTQTGSLYRYNYSIADGTGELAVVDIAVSPGIAISGLTAPGGASAFQTSYDSVLGLVSFIENNAIFSAMPLSGFMFDSTVAPNASTFGVTLFDGTTGSGSVQAPVSGSVVPEPASLALCTFGGAALLYLRKRLFASHA